MLIANRDGTVLERAMGMLLFIGGVLVCMSVTWSFSQGINQRMVAGLVAAIFVIVALVAPVGAICLTFIWLAILGDVRRLFIYDTGIIENDPLLLVGPVVAIAIAAIPFINGRLEFNARLPKMIMILMVFMFIQVFNPIQGGLMVGLAGGMFYLVPLLWFWIGQAYGTEENFGTVLFKVVFIVGVLACALGIWQGFFAFLPYQEEWVSIMRKRFLSLNVGSRVRPFGFFVSPSEFAHYCMVLIMIGFAPLARGILKPVVILLPLAGACLLIQGGRGPLLFGAGGLAWIWALSAKRLTGLTVLGRISIAMLVAFGALLVMGAVAQTSGVASSVVAPMVQRQAAGLLNPLDQRESTVIDHLQLGMHGVILGFQYPLGKGLGSTTLAGARNAEDGEGAVAAGVEIDFGNMFVSLGFIGGFFYIAICCYIFYICWQLCWRKRSITAVMIFGILVSQIFQWLNGQQYAIAALVWFCIGVLERQYRAMKHEEAGEAEEAAALA